ncbi:MAG: lipase family protein [Isosphaeraceae bacterium]
MTLRLEPDSPKSPDTAAYLGLACELAYLPDALARPRFADELGLDAKLISVDNTQVYVGTNETSMVLAFRGSESPESLDGFKDWLLTNASNFLVLPEGDLGTDFVAAGVGARFHRGFLQALDAIWAPLYAEVERAMTEKERPIWVTGHSLGGALALLASWRLARKFYPPCCIVTFGAPMIGNEAAAQAFEREFSGKIVRYVDEFDLVPLLPRVALLANDYSHCPAEERLAAAIASANVDTPADAVLQSIAGSVAQAVLDATMIDNLWAGLKHRIAHHMISNYLARLEERRKSPV